MNLTRNIILICAGAMLMASCSLEKRLDKAQDLLRENRQTAAAFCINEFPDSNTIIITVDSISYNESVGELQAYCDSILAESDARLRAINSLTEYIDGIENDGRYDAGVINELQAKLAAIKPVDLKKLRASIEAEIKTAVKPCKDTTITKVPTKEIEYWKLESEKQKAHAEKYEDKNAHKGQVIWWLIIALIGMTIFAFRRLILKALTA